MRPQLISVMCNKPSTPPKSTKTPKSVMFLMVPSRTWPFSIRLIISTFWASISLSIKILWETTALRKTGLILTTLNSMVLPTYWS